MLCPGLEFAGFVVGKLRDAFGAWRLCKQLRLVMERKLLAAESGSSGRDVVCWIAESEK